MTKLKAFSTLCAASALALTAGMASAATITVTNVVGSWQNVVGASSSANSTIKITDNNTQAPKLRFGTPTGQPDKSGYDFVGIAPPPLSVSPDVDFSLGTFSHLNNIIVISPSTSILSAELKVSYTFFLDTDAGNPYTLESVFKFAHLETPNDGTCPNGPNNTGVNINGCADRVTAVTNPAKSDSFWLGDDEYVLAVSGFDMGKDFWTVEKQTNNSQLMAHFTLKSNVAPVPLPAAGFLLLGGLGALGALSRRRKAA